jgi:exodeoxyribonuclease V alpha subunit
MRNEAVFSRIDFAFAEFLAKQTKLKPEDRKTFKEIVAKLSASKSQGHSCISITDKDKLIIEASGVSGTSGSEALIIENKTLYMQRYF